MIRSLLWVLGAIVAMVLVVIVWRSWGSAPAAAAVPVDRAALTAELEELGRKAEAKVAELAKLREAQATAWAALLAAPTADLADATAAHEAAAAEVKEVEEGLLALQRRRAELAAALEALPPDVSGFATREWVSEEFATKAELETLANNTAEAIDAMDGRVTALEGSVAELTGRMTAAEAKLRLAVTAEQARTLANAEAQVLRAWVDEALTAIRDAKPATQPEREAVAGTLTELNKLRQEVARLQEAANASGRNFTALKSDVEKCLTNCKAQTVQTQQAVVRYYTTTPATTRCTSGTRCRLFRCGGCR